MAITMTIQGGVIIASTFILPPTQWITVIGLAISVSFILPYPLLTHMLRSRFDGDVDDKRIITAYAKALVATIAACVIGLLCRKTAMGMMVESVGINPEASRMTGIKPKKILFLVYAISGLLAAVAGLFATASVMRVDVVKTGQDLEMYAILAVVIGGTSLLGGKFSLAGSALGAVIIAMIRKTIITLGIDSAATPAFFAVVVIVICVMQAPKIHNLSANMKRKRALKAQAKAVAA